MASVLEKWPSLDRLLRPALITAPVEGANRRTRVFISYRSEDPDISLAQRFYEELRSAGHETFMAGESLRLGDEWPQTVVESQADTSVVLKEILDLVETDAAPTPAAEEEFKGPNSSTLDGTPLPIAEPEWPEGL